MATILSSKTSGVGGLAVTGDSSGILQLASADGTTAVTIDASQNVGIGTSTTGTNGVLTVYKTLEPKIYLTDATVGQTYGGAIKGYGITGIGGAVELGSVDNNVYSKGWFYSLSSGYQAFYTNSAERMRIDNTGNLFVGGTTQNTATAPVYSSTTAKAWVQYNAATPAVLGSFNVSSVTRTATGNFTVNFTAALVDANYAPLVSCNNINAETKIQFGTIAAGSLQILSQGSVNTTSSYNPVLGCVVFR